MPCDDPAISQHVECYEEVEANVKDFAQLMENLTKASWFDRPIEADDLKKLLTLWKDVNTYIEALEEAVLLGPEEP